MPSPFLFFRIHGQYRSGDGVASAATLATSNDSVVYKACISLFVIQTLSFHSNIVFFNIYVLLRVCVCGAEQFTLTRSLYFLCALSSFWMWTVFSRWKFIWPKYAVAFGSLCEFDGWRGCVHSLHLFAMIPWDARSLNILDNLRMTLTWMKCQREYTQNHVTHKYTFNVIIKMQKRKGKEKKRNEWRIYIAQRHTTRCSILANQFTKQQVDGIVRSLVPILFNRCWLEWVNLKAVTNFHLCA